MSAPRRSLLLHGVRLMLARPGAVLWTYAFNLGLALLFSASLHGRLSAILDHSLAAERLNSAFDVGTLGALYIRLQHGSSSPAASYLGLPVYLLVYFLLVPGTLFCYLAEVPCKLRILLSQGMIFFWSFVRITLLTVMVSLVVLAPLSLAAGTVGRSLGRNGVESHQWYGLLAFLPVFLVASALRLYFDLVEVYTVRQADRYLPSGRADRRVRRVLLPALRTLARNFARAYVVFLTLTLGGFAVFVLCSLSALHHLAQPRSWPVFLLAQLGLLAMLVSRYWQRAAETVLVCDNPLPLPAVLPGMPTMTQEMEPTHLPHPEDAQPDPEPAVPSLDEPDPAVYHHAPGESERER